MSEQNRKTPTDINNIIESLSDLSIENKVPLRRSSRRILEKESTKDIMVRKSSPRNKKSSGISKNKIVKQLKHTSDKKALPPLLFKKPIVAKCKDIYMMEISSSDKKAYYLSGPAGAGKSTIYRSVFAPIKHSYYNLDTYYEYLLDINHLLMNHNEKETYESLKKEIYNELKRLKIDFDTPEKEGDAIKFLASRNISSIKSYLMTIAQKCIKEDLDEILKKTPTIVIDKPAANYNAIVKSIYEPLEKEHYSQYMVFVYTPLFTALKNNQCRGEEEICGRVIYDFIILESWIDSIENIPKFQKLFGENMICIDNSRNTKMIFEEKELRETLSNYKIDKVNRIISRIKATESIIESLVFTPIDTLNEKLDIN